MSAQVTRPTPLPAALEVRELIEGLLGRDVGGTVGTGAVDPAQHPGAVVGVYVDNLLKLKALVVLDMPLAAHVGAAIALIPATGSRAAVEDGLLTPALYDNTAEVLNVAASLFNADGAPHLRLYEAYAPREALPPDVAKWVLAYVQRLDLELEISGYGSGRASVLVL
ncbi:hypothetical protein [Actinotalea sp. K2]|uniref:hypothetical protein n=1 Tax=Actinotalea sp. K2 TaxID=2939438 RepID=UPI0020174E3B|nr:hypothetical protein [Actinotalea sp. K2]MCL3860896.1 hypothetical protein [Actinotalea sp. K2]